ncbi:hypothetical protein KY290_001327 [Solanum tuberosum]|uniref:Uncharacterized protein n=1 Tax=Solanum tuberosum TaxID=4113 RepID=A0ABQ7WM12_SOLTU|nr:hypothetical protein KY289_001486 [Solanum tuberosum]KAH0765366.1 hypothetical protein KY285_001237 [Solanum tuberosum]KAH0781729.1 hypothetical protein KY290_001327 [Solanum tuberosum]
MLNCSLRSAASLHALGTIGSIHLSRVLIDCAAWRTPVHLLRLVLNATSRFMQLNFSFLLSLCLLAATS